MFPYVVDATFPAAGSHVTFRYLRPIVNGDHSRFDVRVDTGSRSHSDESELYDDGAFSNES